MTRSEGSYKAESTLGKEVDFQMTPNRIQKIQGYNMQQIHVN